MNDRMRFFVTTRRCALVIALVSGCCVAPAMVRAQAVCPIPMALDPEWGDAPEGAQAYPDLGVPGLFPTCSGGPAECIQHAQNLGGPANNAFFGPSLDYEPDGNGGQCPPPFYENDECDYSDGDAGLVRPTPFTWAPQGPPIAQPCRAGPPVHLYACSRARWGRDIDITLSNFLWLGGGGAGQTVFLNVIADFDRSGDWQAFPAGALNCSGVQVPEHIVRNMLVPSGFSGLASQLGLADFDVSADSGYVWFRFTLSTEPVLFPWTGAGFWEAGETEDYMLHVSSGTPPQEYGDAPYGVDAYPGFNVQGQFPTCVQNPAHLVHPAGGGLYFGTDLDYEFDGNGGDCSFTAYDRDECFGGDAGLIVPRPHTLQPTPGGPVAEPCAMPATDLGVECTPIAWGPGLDIQITNAAAVPAFLNMLADWDQNGRWGDPPFLCNGPVFEHVLRNIPIPSGFNGTLSQLALPFRAMGRDGYVWTRFTLSTIAAPSNWDGSGNMGEGETEDYLLRVTADPTDTQSSQLGALRVGAATPNPTFAGAQIDLDLPAGGDITVAVYDAQGRLVRDVGVRSVRQGAHRVVWDGLDAAGNHTAAGVYFVRLTIGDRVVTRRVLRLN